MKTTARIKSALLVSIASLMIMSCNEATESTSAPTAEELNVDLLTLERERDSISRLYEKTVADIDARLDKIRDEKGVLVIGPGGNFDGSGSKVSEIMGNIDMLEKMITESDERIKLLGSKLLKANKEYMAVKEKLTVSEEKNEFSEGEIVKLQKQLADEYAVRDKLLMTLDEQMLAYERLNVQYQDAVVELNTAYYITGTRSELKKMNVVEKGGSVFGFASENKLAKRMNSDNFVRIDIRASVSIPVHAKKAQLVTYHNPNSYAWEKDKKGINSLVITNPKLFWETSKVLVIEKKGEHSSDLTASN